MLHGKPPTREGWLPQPRAQSLWRELLVRDEPRGASGELQRACAIQYRFRGGTPPVYSRNLLRRRSKLERPLHRRPNPRANPLECSYPRRCQRYPMLVELATPFRQVLIREDRFALRVQAEPS